MPKENHHFQNGRAKSNEILETKTVVVPRSGSVARHHGENERRVDLLHRVVLFHGVAVLDSFCHGPVELSVRNTQRSGWRYLEHLVTTCNNV